MPGPQPMRRLMLLLTLGLMSVVGHAQVNMDAYRDYFLVGQFGEVCTMCEVTVVCQSGSALPAEDALPATGEFTLYHLQTRTFWSQVSTIWDWFVANFRQNELASRGHTRPVHVYHVRNGNWPAMQVIEARLILDPGIIEFGDHTIDRTNRAWAKMDGDETAGYCSRLPLWDTLEVIEAEAPIAEP